MNSFSSRPSLIPYLMSSDNQFYLALSKNNMTEGMEDALFPFSVISTSDPFALILQASIVSDAHSPIQKVFLLIQKDEYLLRDDTLWPVCNNDIDQAWQDSFSLLRRQSPNPPVIILKDQIDDRENLLPWRPLFYCMRRQVFFHPSCPRCGCFLDMCSDDDTLIGIGLQAYSKSLKRYLFCPQCQDTGGKTEFYIHAKDVFDPPTLKDRRDLISGFGTRRPNLGEGGDTPCPDCTNFTECYDSGNLAFSRIVSLSFYPFFTLLLSAPSLHVFDFLPLLSGATFEDRAGKLKAEGQMGRWGCLTQLHKGSRRSLFFFEGEERCFLEILYLKLSLLGELAQIVFSNLEKLRHPELGLSIDRLWIDIAEQNSMLPLFWNFKLKSLGVGLDPANRPFFSKMPPTYGLYLLGSTWFYALLANSKQLAPVIYEEAARALEKISLEGDADSQNSLIDNPESVFAPENIFWEPDDKVVNPAWKTFWLDSLKIGFLLLENSRNGTVQWSEDTFWREIGRLRKDVKNALFGLEPLQGAAPMEADKIIRHILTRISGKWQSSRKVVTPEEERAFTIPTEDTDTGDDIVIKETVILSPQEFAKERYSPEILEEKTQAGGKPIPLPPDASMPTQPLRKEEIDLPETIIVRPESYREVDFQSPQSSDHDIPETVIISPKKTPVSSPGADRLKSGEGTDSNKMRQSSLEEIAQGGSEGKADKKKDDQDDLPETIIFRKEK